MAKETPNVVTSTLAAVSGAGNMVANLVKPKPKKGSGKPKVTVHKVESPVFPVSDARGYEVVGTWRYGRGQDIEPDGVFDVLHKMDPLSLLDSQTIKAVVDAVAGNKTAADKTNALRNKLVKAGVKNGDIAPSEIGSGGDSQGDLNRKVLSQLRQHLTDKNIIDLGLARRNTADPTILDFDFRNFIAGSGTDGISRLPINNAAYTLADLGVHDQNHVCSCKMAEADLLLDVAADSDFVHVSETVDNDADVVTQWSVRQALSTMPSWQQSQEALRGSASGQAGPTRANAIRGLFDGTAFRSSDQAVAAARKALAEDRARLKSLLDKNDTED